MAPVSPVRQGAMEVIRGYNGTCAPRALWKTTRVRDSRSGMKFGNYTLLQAWSGKIHTQSRVWMNRMSQNNRKKKMKDNLSCFNMLLQTFSNWPPFSHYPDSRMTSSCCLALVCLQIETPGMQTPGSNQLFWGHKWLFPLLRWGFYVCFTKVMKDLIFSY